MTHFTIPTGATRAQFVRIVEEILLEDAASSMRIADAALYALTAWESEGLELMCDATGFKQVTIRKSARIAKEFPPGSRVTGFGFGHYRRLLPFPRDWSVEFLKRHAGKTLSNRALYALAVEALGKTPHEKKQAKKSSVRLLDTTIARLRQFSGRKIAHLIEKVLNDWLSTQPDVPTPAVVTPEPVARRTFHPATDRAVAVNEGPRPTYAERRQAQLDAGAPRIPEKKKRVRKPRKLVLAWLPCQPASFIDGENGAAPYRASRISSATKFYSPEEAVLAEQKFFEERGYHQRVEKCPTCSGGNARRPVWHVVHIFPGQMAAR